MKSSPKRKPPILGIDWGMRRIGIAISPDGKHVFSRKHLTVVSENDAIEQCAKLIHSEGIETVILGLPISLSGEAGAMATKVNSVGNTLHQRTNVPVFFQDERLSSREATHQQLEGATASTDSLAAAILLETYLHSDL